jgi:hypothetical protein
MKRYPLYPAVNQSLQDTRAQFGVDSVIEISDEDRECAANFDVSVELKKALEQREKSK